MHVIDKIYFSELVKQQPSQFGRRAMFSRSSEEVENDSLLFFKRTNIFRVERISIIGQKKITTEGGMGKSFVLAK